MRTKSLSSFLAMFCALGATVDAEDLQPVNVKFMMRGYCHAAGGVDKEALGGFAPSNNHPKKLTESGLGRDGEVSLVALPGETVPFAEKYRGMKLLVVNRSKHASEFNASDSRLSIVQQAFHEGEWKPIEYLPSSWCGNSYHRVYLPAKHYWEFAVPAYTGSIKTKLRFVLDGDGLHSNEFEGSVNPEQFTQKQGHTPTNIMDPYNE